MKTHVLRTSQLIKADMPKVWDFFSSPLNLKVLTPDYMDFRVLYPDTLEKMHAGQIIEYKVKPVMRFPIHWVTEITHCEKNSVFVDEQRFGPYRLWHHQHHFQETSTGILMKDVVTYALPYGVIGNSLHSLFVKKQLDSIFDYRRKRVSHIFGV